MAALSRPRCLVVGGGVAGVTAAVALAQAGRQVTLCEQRPTLGGKASSFVPPGRSQLVDNSQHVLLRCCTSLLALYETLGTADLIDWHDSLPLLAEDGTRGAFRAWSALPPPLNLAPAMLALPGLSVRDRLMLGLAFGRMILADRHRPDDRTFAQWLGRCTTTHLDRGFWRLMLTSVLNAEADQVSARYALLFFLDGLMRHRQAYHLGVPRVPLSVLHHDAPIAWLSSRGHRVCTRTLATVRPDTGGFAARLGEATERFDAVVLAVRPEQVARVVDAELATELVGDLPATMTAESIVGVHLWFDQPVDWPPVLGLMRHDVDWVFALDGGRRLSVVTSAARSWQGLSPAAAAQRAVAALRAVDPRLPEPSAHAACREAQATFVPAPGLDARRPGAATTVPGLALAGVWTNTGWPATMEGAARSGYRAAEALTGQELVPTDLPRQGLFRVTC
ncbi:MAG: FAD-dependent oxidoreductase [Armatimonadetes bacterium]|nr:FAD-dependent oxidoreductase [Armatimonadota bacterium]